MKTPRLLLRKHMLWLAVMAAGALPSAAAGTTFYVNGTCGSNGWTGTSPVCAGPNGPKSTIQAAIDSTANGDEVVVANGTYTGSGNRNLDFGGRGITVRSAGGPYNCVIDCQGSGRAFYLHSGEPPETVIQGFTITNGSAGVGGALELWPGDALIADCVFTNNTAEVGGALHHQGIEETVLANCTFSGNTAEVGGGAIASFGPARLRVVGCVFADNEGDGGGAVATSHLDTAFVNCLFAGNVADFMAGGIADGSGYTALINCVLSRNEAGFSAGGDFGNLEAALINCTVSGNLGGGIGGLATAEAMTVSNSIVWGNSLWQFQEPAVDVVHSDVQGGWPGTGNINADPLFVQPGTDDVRLSVGSPCANAADNTALPPDELDLDDDGDTSEPLPVDLDGNPRVQGGTVDMGAYEGESDQEAPAAGEDDLDQGESVVLVPTGGEADPLQSALVFVANTSGPDDATFVVTEYEGDIHPGAEGYSELSCILSNETSLADGQWRSTQIIPFDADDLGPMSPAEVNLTRYDPETGNWSLAVTGNTVDSPGCDGPVGDRVVVLEGGDWGLTNDLGDYGVYWDPAVGQGFAWAKVDAAADFGLGVALCPADCRQTPDGVVGSVDFLALLSRWGEASLGGPCDINFDGVVEKGDFFALLMAWGPCSPAALPVGGGPSARQVPVPVRADLAVLRTSWGRCAGDCPADLDGDGVVGVKDLLAVLAAWPSG